MYSGSEYLFWGIFFIIERNSISFYKTAVALPRSLSPFYFVYFTYICFILGCYVTFFAALVVAVSSFAVTSSRTTPSSSILLMQSKWQAGLCGSLVNTEKTSSLIFFFHLLGRLFTCLDTVTKGPVTSWLQTCFVFVFYFLRVPFVFWPSLCDVPVSTYGFAFSFFNLPYYFLLCWCPPAHWHWVSYCVPSNELRKR